MQLEQVVAEPLTALIQTRLPAPVRAEPWQRVDSKSQDVQLRQTNKDHAVHWTTHRDYREQKRERHRYVEKRAAIKREARHPFAQRIPDHHEGRNDERKAIQHAVIPQREEASDGSLHRQVIDRAQRRNDRKQKQRRGYQRDEQRARFGSEGVAIEFGPAECCEAF